DLDQSLNAQASLLGDASIRRVDVAAPDPSVTERACDPLSHLQDAFRMVRDKFREHGALFGWIPERRSCRVVLAAADATDDDYRSSDEAHVVLDHQPRNAQPNRHDSCLILEEEVTPLFNHQPKLFAPPWRHPTGLLKATTMEPGIPMACSGDRLHL